MWSIVSVIFLLAGTGMIVWYYAKQYDEWRADFDPIEGVAKEDLVENTAVSPSMRATAKYFWLVSILFCVQVLLGMVTAHYTVEGQGIYGLPFTEYFPYSMTRTWHAQLPALWIATGWLATGLYVAPMLFVRDPKSQAFGMNFLFVSLIIIVAGSFIG